MSAQPRAPSTSSPLWRPYLEGGDPEELLQASGKVIDRHLPLAPEHVAHVSALTAEPIEIETYSDAAHAIRRWFAAMREPV